MAMRVSHRLLWLAGFDVAVVRALGPSSARRLVLIALANALPCGLMGAGAGYAAQLVQGFWPLSLAVGGAFALFVLNLLRVAVAGGGIAPHQPERKAERFRPALPPVLVIALLAGLLAQPAILPLFAAELEPAVAAHRAALLRQHRAVPDPVLADARSEAGRLRREHAERYARNIALASFAARRITLVWREPAYASALTLAFVLLCISPLLLARLPLVSALRHYELTRRQRLQVLLHAFETATAREVHAALSRFASYEPPAPRAASAGELNVLRPSWPYGAGGPP